MKIGIAGAGMIVPTFLEAAALVDSMEIYGLFARKEEVRKEICEKYGIPVGYGSYEEFLKDGEIDAVYVALPNSLHFSFAKAALEAGKHVILEKPFTVTLSEARELAELSRKKGLWIFEAITTVYNPNYEKIQELLPRLGDVKLVQLNFSQYSSRYDKFKEGIISPVFDPSQAGGALMDINVYNIHFVVGLFGRPERVHYYPHMERGVDTSGVLLLEYPGFCASCVGAKDSASPFFAVIQGDRGYIQSEDAVNSLSSFVFKETKGETKEYRLVERKERLFYELKTFAEYYERGDKEAFEKRLDHSLTVMEVLDEARQ